QDTAVTTLFDELRESPMGQQAYNEAALIARLLEGGPEKLASPSSAELLGSGQAVLERLRLAPDAQPTRSPLRLLAWLGGVAAVGAALLIALPFFNADGPADLGERGAFQARGAPSEDGKHVGLRLFCLGPKVSMVHELRDVPVGSCSLGATLKFAITNRSELRYLFLVGVDARHEALWYRPMPPRTESFFVAKKIVDKPLERAVRLEINHQRGKLRVYALFSSHPLEAKVVQEAIAKSSKSALSTLKFLPINNIEQRSILIELE
ncbi:MAG: hypothetical protein JRH20_13615, partial [Deltaproteobacteria bacterium]|nr:hypothetical protein [Deltaproteobacteria bacterium]